jgi:hypothetical protein
VYSEAVKLGRVSLTLLLTFSSTQLGCSFLFVNGPPEEAHPKYDPENDSPCSDSKAWPIMDLVFTGGALGSSLMVAMAGAQGSASPQGDSPSNRNLQGIAIGGLAIAAMLTVSSFWGFHTVNQCRDFLQERDALPRADLATPLR